MARELALEEMGGPRAPPTRLELLDAYQTTCRTIGTDAIDTVVTQLARPENRCVQAAANNNFFFFFFFFLGNAASQGAALIPGRIPQPPTPRTETRSGGEEPPSALSARGSGVGGGTRALTAFLRVVALAGRSLRHLGLSECALGDGGARELCAALGGGACPLLGRLDVSYNGLEGGAVSALAALVASGDPPLEVLDLSGNFIGGKLGPLEAALRSGSSRGRLRLIRLSDNELQPAGIASLGKVLAAEPAAPEGSTRYVWGRGGGKEKKKNKKNPKPLYACFLENIHSPYAHACAPSIRTYTRNTLQTKNSNSNYKQTNKRKITNFRSSASTSGRRANAP
jgi:hypothetical protein